MNRGNPPFIVQFMNELYEAPEYQTIVAAFFENLVPQEDRQNCSTCGLVVNDHTMDELGSKIFHCDECGKLPWCGRTACDPVGLSKYEFPPDQERHICVNCAQELGLLN
jgi:hypothetical protein